MCSSTLGFSFHVSHVSLQKQGLGGGEAVSSGLGIVGPREGGVGLGSGGPIHLLCRFPQSASCRGPEMGLWRPMLDGHRLLRSGGTARSHPSHQPQLSSCSSAGGFVLLLCK